MTDTAKTQVTQDAIITEIEIAAPPERVFQALIDPGQVVRWWGQEGVYRCTEFAADVRAGGKWRSAGIGPDGGNFEVTGEYLQVEPPRLLVSSWIASWTGSMKTTIRWELNRAAKGTQVTLRHTGLSAYLQAAKSYQGWPRMLGWLKDFLEHNETVETRAPLSATGTD